MVRSSKVQLAAARINGTAMSCVQVGRLTEAEALAEIAGIVAALPREDRQRALDQAAAPYMRPAVTDVWHASVARLLDLAGADLVRALRIYDAAGGRIA